MTNRDLAERIANAVLDAGERIPGQAVDAVLDVMGSTGHAFVRLDTDANGVTVEHCMDDDVTRTAFPLDAREQRAGQKTRSHQCGLFHE